MNAPDSNKAGRPVAALRAMRLTASAVAILAAGVALGFALGRRSDRGPPALPTIGAAPSYTLTNALNQPVTSAAFKGKVRLVTFLFPYCTTYCPLIAAHLVGFENALKDAGLQNQVEIVSFNVDPAGSGPAVMRAFLKEYGWNPRNSHWQYLTGNPTQIRRVVTSGYHIAYSRVADGKAGNPDQTPQPEVVNTLVKKHDPGYDITHNDALIVVDTRGNIRKIYGQADLVSNQQLLRTVKRLLNQRHT